ncbi:hypothetical protein [Cellulomonas sp. URHB0016]
MAVTHYEAAFDQFAVEYFGASNRRTLVIAGVGFDPRTSLLCEKLAEVNTGTLDGVFVREERSAPPNLSLLPLAEDNYARLKAAVQSHRDIQIDVFEEDGAVQGGRVVADAISRLDLHDYTDVVVDLSAMSVGISYPLVRLLRTMHCDSGRPANLHLVVAHQPDLDAQI